MKKALLITVLLAIGFAAWSFQDAVPADKAAEAPKTAENTPISPTAIAPAVTPENPAPVAPTPMYQLRPLFDINKIIVAEEEQKWDGIHTINPGDKPETYPFLRHNKYNFTEHILMMSGDHRSIHSQRTYTFSRLKTNTPGEGRKDESISLEGRTLRLETMDSHITKMEKIAPKDGVIITEDYDYVSALTWFYLLLPQEPLTIGETYELNSQKVAEIFFRNSYDEKLCKAVGSGTLESKMDYEGVPCLKTTISLKLTRDDPVNNTTIEIELAGAYIVSIEQKVIVDLDLSGSFVINNTAQAANSKKKVAVKTEGNIITKLKLREGAAEITPPAVKQAPAK
ncbi:MAG: hypothetical protein WC980_05920 [Candidatus Brocadiia bacterium]